MDHNTMVHYGIKGMKWGIRRTPDQITRSVAAKVGGGGSEAKRSTKASSSTLTKSSKATSSPKKETKNVKDMSDDELRKMIGRLELEKKYRDLSSEVNKKKLSRGREFANRIIEKIGENTITNLGTQAANHVLGNAINKFAGVSSTDTVNRIVNPQKGQSDKK